MLAQRLGHCDLAAKQAHSRPHGRLRGVVTARELASLNTEMLGFALAKQYAWLGDSMTRPSARGRTGGTMAARNFLLLRPMPPRMAWILGPMITAKQISLIIIWLQNGSARRTETSHKILITLRSSFTIIEQTVRRTRH